MTRSGRMQVVDLPAIEKALAGLDLLPLIESGFEAYSAGRTNVPPIGELLMDKGEVHIKYGCITGDPYYVIKIASGFPDNPARGLAPGNGLMLLCSQDTGEIVAVLHDQAHLTDVRTAVAGAIAAKYLAPRAVTRIGILGTGVQARLQLSYLACVTACRDALIWGRNPERLSDYVRDMAGSGFDIETTTDTDEIVARCNLIVTTTAAEAPLLEAGQIRAGTHISAIGSDTPDKQELDTSILARADLVVADSVQQCQARGEIYKALAAGSISNARLIEIGDVIGGRAQGRTDDSQITVFDSTGVAVQDMMISRAVFEALGSD
ncbi:MAG: ornithine cyclodeaminase family protein [Gammaproteobacteria bacterium]